MINNSRLSSSRKRIIFQTEGSFEVGFGHLHRSLSLAECLVNNFNVEADFIINTNDKSKEILEEKGFKQVNYNFLDIACESNNKHNIKFFQLNQISCLFIDSLNSFNEKLIKEIKHINVKIFSIDTNKNFRLFCDAIFFPPVPQIKEFKWNNFKGKLYIGWKWVPLRTEFLLKKDSVQYSKEIRKPVNILVSMGGSDPKNLTRFVLDSLLSSKLNLNISVIIGPDGRKEKLPVSSSSVTLNYYHNVSKMSELIINHDIGIISYGLIAFEVASLGLPSIHICLSKDHAKSSSAFSSENMAISLGYYLDIFPEEIHNSIEKLINDNYLRENISSSCLKNIDANGCLRIAKTIYGMI